MGSRAATRDETGPSAAPTQDVSGGWRQSARRHGVPIGVGVLLLAVFVARAEDSLRRESPVWDETMHLDYGLNFLRLGARVPAGDHPYPVTALLALPLALQQPEPGQVLERLEVPGTSIQAELRRIEDPRNLHPARRMNVAIAALGLALAAGWLARRSGWGVGLGFLALGTLDPGWLAAARYATTDVAHGLAFLGGGLALAQHRMRGGLGTLVLAGLFGTLGLAAKFSGIVLVAGAAVAMLVPLPGDGRYDVGRRLGAAAKATLVVAIVAVGGWLLLFQVHVLAGIASPADGWHRVVASLGEFARVRALPRGTFLLGGFHPEGSRAYLPVLLAAKTPLALVLAAILGLLLPEGRSMLRAHRPFLGVLLVFLVVAVASNVNLGHRHLTPFLPFLWLSGAAGLVALVRSVRRGGWLAGMLGILLAAEGGLAHPHYLAFTNGAFGGVQGAHRVAVDSASDWGQDLPLLARYLRDHPPDSGPVHLAYFGTADPAAYGIHSVWLPCRPLGRPRPRGAPAASCGTPAEVMAVSATCLQGAAGGTTRDDCYAGLRHREPDAVLGGSILVFRNPLPAAPILESPGQGEGREPGVNGGP